MGSLDVFNNRISACQYKTIIEEKVHELIKLKKVPILEGGCSFYLKYLITNREKRFDDEVLKKAAEQATEIINKYEKNGEKM